MSRRLTASLARSGLRSVDQRCRGSGTPSIVQHGVVNVDCLFSSTSEDLRRKSNVEASHGMRCEKGSGAFAMTEAISESEALYSSSRKKAGDETAKLRIAFILRVSPQRLAYLPQQMFQPIRSFSVNESRALSISKRPETEVAEVVASADELMVVVKDLKEVVTAKPNHYFLLSNEMQKKYLGGELPATMSAEFEVSQTPAIMVRQKTLELIGRLEAARVQLAQALPAAEIEGGEESHSEAEEGADRSPFPANQIRRNVLLEGLPGSGKTFALATAVLWARATGWLVFYVPSGSSWTKGGLYYRHREGEDLWDTPIQARSVLENFHACHKHQLSELPIRSLDRLALGEGLGTGLARGPQEVVPQAGWTLLDLVDLGLANPHAAVSVVVRLREELAHVTKFPVLIAIDEYNAWFTLSSFWKATGERSRSPLHANQLRMVNAFRPMAGEGAARLAKGVTVAAFSESIGVGRLPAQLPGVPRRVRLEVPRYSPFEARSALLFYQRRVKDKKEAPHAEAMKRLFFLTNGNGFEIRKLAHLV